MGKAITIEYLRSLLEKAAEIAGCHPQDVTERMLLDLDPNLTNWKLRKFGRMTGIKKYYPIQNIDLAEIHQQKDIKKYINSLEKRVGEKESLENKLYEAIVTQIKPIKVTPYKIKKKPVKTKREIVAMLNDTHYGLIVKPEEVANVNKYNWNIASRRTAFFIDEICKYKQDKRNEIECLHFLLNGDLIAGVIHGLFGRDNDLLTHQFNGTLHILSNAIKHLSENFPRVKVYFSTGNHGDAPHRREGGRVSSQIFDSFEGMIFYALSTVFKSVKNLEFIAGHTLFQDFQLPAGRAMFTHGHLLFSKELGSPGSSVNTKAISDSIMRFNDGEIAKGLQKIKLVLLGHSHSHYHITTKDGVHVYNAPSLSGTDSYAFKLGINHNQVGQLMFESTDKYIFGDSRLLYVQEADDKAEYDKIIPPYNYELTNK